MLDVGLIGLGPEWESRYRPALTNLRHRLRLRVVQTAVGTLAEQTAVEWRCDPAPGLRAAIERNDVRALLILDRAWYGHVPVEFACRTGKSAFLAGRLADWIPFAGELARLASDTETTLMPDFGHRYTPATSRAKELIASRLGRVESIVVETRASPPGNGSMSSPANGAGAARQEALLSALDWACHLVGTAAAEVRGETGPEGTEEIVVSFKRSAAGGAPTTARVVLRVHPGAQHSEAGASGPVPGDSAVDWSAEIRCLKGSARLTGGTHIAWTHGSEQRAESLSSERSGVEVMLDHFSRRVVGGLIPVPTLEDLHRVARLAEAAGESRRTGKPAVLA